MRKWKTLGCPIFLDSEIRMALSPRPGKGSHGKMLMPFSQGSGPRAVDSGCSEIRYLLPHKEEDWS